MPADRPFTEAEVPGTLPGFEAGVRREHTEYRVIVNPDDPRWRWRYGTIAPWRDSTQLGSTSRVECRTVVTYTSPWREARRD